MALKCAFCDNDNADVVCHHCSKPLCPAHRRLHPADPAFNKREYTYPFVLVVQWWHRLQKIDPPATVAACHCTACLRRYHLWYVLISLFTAPQVTVPTGSSA